MRDVAAGEELCFDYAMTDTDDYDEFACSCGTASCRGTVTGADWKEPELRDRYRGWRSAYIERRDSSSERLRNSDGARSARHYRRRMDPRERFVAAVNRPAAEVPLDVAALCIAAHAHPGLDVDAWLARLDALAARCPAPTFDALRAHLFEHEGFAGNLDHYDDPENSFLDSVIERRLGIPITLSVLMIAVGRRLGVDVQGVGMPGHFLVLDGLRGDVWCDPFHGGALLDADGCRRRFDLVYGGALAFQRAFLAPTPPPAIVARMLANLERSELATDPVQRAWMCELHLAIPGIAFQEQLELADQLAPPATSCARRWCSKVSPTAPSRIGRRTRCGRRRPRGCARAPCAPG